MVVGMNVDDATGNGSTRDARDARLTEADLAGTFPEGFYATTNFPTEVRVAGVWHRVEGIEMDLGLVVRQRQGEGEALCVEGVPMHGVRVGDRIVVGEEGVRVLVPVAPTEDDDEAFRFMGSGVSTERPKALLVAKVATAMRAARASQGKILLVGGPAIVHSGSALVLERLVREGWIDVLFAGNALAAHDIEAAMFGTSLGIDLAKGAGVPHGHQHHLRAINRVRRAGSIAEAVRQGLVTSGVMHACVTKGVPFVLAGSIRDDGPLPDVITDTLAAQDAMRAQLPGVTVAILVATTLHGVATGNMLPASVATFCVDSSEGTVIKLVDRGTHQAVGIVTDCAYFLSELARGL
jgi:lysine-ketoglutarate reductase/saccharopine dehydrogenase-like protein (TIGR00300 family)